MEVFKTFGLKLEIHLTRAYVANISYEEAQAASKQLEWVQFHVIKNVDGSVNASFILNREVSNALWKFIGGDEPDPQLA